MVVHAAGYLIFKALGAVSDAPRGPLLAPCCHAAPAAAAGVGLFASMARVGGGFLALARPGSLALLLGVAGVSLLEAHPALAGACVALA